MTLGKAASPIVSQEDTTGGVRRSTSGGFFFYLRSIGGMRLAICYDRGFSHLHGYIEVPFPGEARHVNCSLRLITSNYFKQNFSIFGQALNMCTEDPK